MKKVFVFILMLISYPQKTISQVACSELSAGWRLLEKENFSEAEKFFKSALSNISPQNSKACLAYCYYGIAKSANEIKVAEQYYKKAIDLYRKPIVLYDSSFYIYSLRELAELYCDDADYSTAEPLLREALVVQKKIAGENNSEYAAMLSNLGSLYKKLRNYQAAELSFKEAIEIQAKTTGEENSAYASILTNLANLYKVTDKFSQAESLLEKALSIQKKTVGIRDPAYSISLNSLAELYNKLGKYADAEPLYIEALSIQKEALGEHDQQYSISLSCLASLYRKMGDLNESERLYKQALAIDKLNLGESHLDYALSLANLALLYYEMGKYAESESLFKQTLSIQQSKLREQDPQVLATKSNLSSLYIVMGKYQSADSTYLEVDGVNKQTTSPSNSEDYASLSNQANYFIQLGDYPNGEKNLKRVVQIIKLKFGITHPEYAKSIANLASLYKNIGELNKAKPLYLEAMEVYKAIPGGKKYPAYALLLAELAGIFREWHIYDKAMQLYGEAIQIQKNNLNTFHPEYAYVIKNIGILYSKMGKYAQAEQNYLEVLKIYKHNLGEKHLTYQSALADLINLYYLSGNYLLAVKNYLVLFKLQNEFIISGTDFFPNPTLSFFLQQRSYFNNTFNTLLFGKKNASNLSRQAQYDNELLSKNFLLRNSRALQRSINASGDTSLINLFKAIKNLRNRLISEIDESRNNLKQAGLEIETEIKEKEMKLIKLSSVFKKGRELFSRNWEDVKKALKPNQAAIEFIWFPYNGLEYSSDDISYMALVLRPNDLAPVCVNLFEEIKLTDLLKRQSNEPDSSYFSRLYSDGNDNILDQLIWKPLDSLLSGVQTIFYAKSGLLHKINMEVLPGARNYQLRSMGSTSEVINSKEVFLKKAAIQKALIFGGIDYDKTATITYARDYSETYQIDHDLSIEQNVRGGVGGTWSFLPGSLREGKSLKGVIEKNGISVAFMEGREASEAYIKSLGSLKEPYILHLATHGYAYPEAKKINSVNTLNTVKSSKPIEVNEKLKLSEEPLLRSGLILSGANKFWNKPGVRSDSIDDGNLTAYDISNIDFSRCELVVLSACQTGLGDIKGNEGVFGLQRAFKMAGAKNIIMSLWDVPDLQTQELMELFYENCFKGNLISKALNDAQKTMSKKYTPYYWAGFVLLQ